MIWIAIEFESHFGTKSKIEALQIKNLARRPPSDSREFLVFFGFLKRWLGLKLLPNYDIGKLGNITNALINGNPY